MAVERKASVSQDFSRKNNLYNDSTYSRFTPVSLKKDMNPFRKFSKIVQYANS